MKAKDLPPTTGLLHRYNRKEYALLLWAIEEGESWIVIKEKLGDWIDDKESLEYHAIHDILIRYHDRVTRAFTFVTTELVNKSKQ